MHIHIIRSLVNIHADRALNALCSKRDTSMHIRRDLYRYSYIRRIHVTRIATFNAKHSTTGRTSPGTFCSHTTFYCINIGKYINRSWVGRILICYNSRRKTNLHKIFISDGTALLNMLSIYRKAC